ncbi:MAG: HesA/MoeB/ThiF family protein [Saprospiraceae bacterium]|nr:HesA/MoeB/ThiF family protein [Saprospiraceae bacterium]
MIDNKNVYQRYQKQMLLKALGVTGQEKLKNSKVLVVGAGGLGCPALLYLAAAGVGTIGIADGDDVEMTNLHRQVLYTMADLGLGKANTAAARLRAINPEISIHTYSFNLDKNNAWDIIDDYDIVLDGSDNFMTRYMINDACAILLKPYVYGAVQQFEGQVGVFNMLDKYKGTITSYRDLFALPPDNKNAISCNALGIIGVLPGIIGTLQATEVIKIITSIGKPLLNQVLTYSALDHSFYTFTIQPVKNSEKSGPKTKIEFLQFDYDFFCNENQVYEISAEELHGLLNNTETIIVDIREKEELSTKINNEVLHIPMSEWGNLENKIPRNQTIIFVCQSGVRSKRAVLLMKDKYPNMDVFSLKDGMNGWLF